MTTAYDEVYLEKARTALGRMLDFAVYDLRFALADFWGLFLATDVCRRFETGDFTVLVGKSGIELAYSVLEQATVPFDRVKSNFATDRSPEYWVGWAMAYYQWKTDIPFAKITRYIHLTDILDLYEPYHEMDIRQFCDKLNELIGKKKHDTNLKLLRTVANLSQQALSDISGVPLRTIQQYEQRQKNINRANAQTLSSLSKALGCRMEDLFD